jgi:hypothetical protein
VYFNEILQKAVSTKTWMSKGIYNTRAKDYENDFRKMVYDTQAEMDEVMGKLANNSFIQQEIQDLEVFKQKISTIKKQLKLK